MLERDEPTKEERRETYAYTLPPSVAIRLAIFAAETSQNKSRALEEVIEHGLVTARALRAQEAA